MRKTSFTHKSVSIPRFRFAHASSRDASIATLAHRINSRYWPRVNAFFIALITALVALFFSAILWRAGMEEMTWRYPAAVILSYPFLLLFLWEWSHRRLWDNWDIGTPEGGSSHSNSPGYSDHAGGGGEYGGAGASDSFDAGDVSSFAGDAAGEVVGGGLEAAASADEGAVVVVPIVLTIALIVLCGGFAFSVIMLMWRAPRLLAELMVDAGTAGRLMVHARLADRQSWLSTATKRTLPSYMGLCVLFLVAGYLLELADPTAITLFDVLANRASQ